MNTSPDTYHYATPLTTCSWSQVRVLVVGLGRFGGGVGVTRWLGSNGARVTVSDLAPAESLAESVNAVKDLGVRLELGGHSRIDPHRFDLVVVSPAVRADSEVFRELLESGVPWTTEINLFCERCPAPVVAVTGSYGKSTTCAMMAHALMATRGSGPLRHREVFLGGNIGGSLLGDLSRITPGDLVVLELSNAQLEHIPRIPWTPELAIISNIHPHHLDRYASFGDYAKVKLNVLGQPQRTQKLVLGPVNAEVLPLFEAAAGGLCSVRRPEAAGRLELAVVGRHNRANAGAVLAAAELMGLDCDVVGQALTDFRGLPHRLESVRAVQGVHYINDSKSTAPQATLTALRALQENQLSAPEPGSCESVPPARNIVLLLGGQSKPEPMEELPAEVWRCCRAVICVGESALTFAEAIAAARPAEIERHSLLVPTAKSLEEAIALATRHASSGDTVLFSPGAPSFDAYANFAERGEHFKGLVDALPRQ